MREKHGLSNNRAYSIWCGMKQRCLNPNSRFYYRYGGRGITICDEWINSFSVFYAYMGDPPEHYTIERIDNEKGYSPQNCRWASRKEQQKNRSICKFVTLEGQTLTAMDWSKKLGIPHQTIYQRIELGWGPEKILSPIKHFYKAGLALGGSANAAKNRAKTHCKWGHEFSPENTRLEKDGRTCRRCHAERQRRRKKH